VIAKLIHRSFPEVTVNQFIEEVQRCFPVLEPGQFIRLVRKFPKITSHKVIRLLVKEATEDAPDFFGVVTLISLTLPRRVRRLMAAS
jgi:hypothetical protein